MANRVCEKCIHYDVCLLHEDNFIEDVEENGFCGKFRDTADVVEVKHGEWETTNVTQEGDKVELFHHQHKECKFGYGDNSPCGYAYCPHCGAKMDGGNNGQN